MQNMKPGKNHTLFSSFRNAARGLYFMVLTQRNARIHLAVALLVIVLGFLIKISIEEWCMIVLAIGMVLAAEGVNTAIEKSVDLASPGYNENARNAKDVAAGAVLLTVIASVVTGLLIFLPRFLALIAVP